MKVNEFVKKYGIAEAKRVLHDARGCVGVKLWGRYEFSTDDLERLIESHELVKSCGGLDIAREKVEVNAVWCNGGSVFLNALKQAILDVESCQ